MHDTYMSEETFNNLSQGDTVTVRRLDDLIHDFGCDDGYDGHIRIPCGWNEDMEIFCGRTLVVDYISRDDPMVGAHIGVIGEGKEWVYSRQMLEPNINTSAKQPTVEISQLWEDMILGKGETNEK